MFKRLLSLVICGCLLNPTIVGYATSKDTVSMRYVVGAYYDYWSGDEFTPTKKDIKDADKLWGKLSELDSNKKVKLSTKNYPNLNKVLAIIENDYLRYTELSVVSEDNGKNVSYIIKGSNVIKAVEDEKTYSAMYRGILMGLGISKKTSKREAISKVHNYLCDSLKYKRNSKKNIKKYDEHACLFTGIGVCEDYSRVFKHLMDTCGIKCGLVLDMDGDHVYNIVVIEGEELDIDVTWNDSTDTSMYLLVGKGAILVDHKVQMVWW